MDSGKWWFAHRLLNSSRTSGNLIPIDSKTDLWLIERPSSSVPVNAPVIEANEGATGTTITLVTANMESTKRITDTRSDGSLEVSRKVTISRRGEGHLLATDHKPESMSP